MQSMARKEAIRTGTATGSSAAGAQVQQQNTYNIYGANAQEVGQEVGAGSSKRTPGCCGLIKAGPADGYLSTLFQQQSRKSGDRS